MGVVLLPLRNGHRTKLVLEVALTPCASHRSLRGVSQTKLKTVAYRVRGKIFGAMNAPSDFYLYT